MQLQLALIEQNGNKECFTNFCFPHSFVINVLIRIMSYLLKTDKLSGIIVCTKSTLGFLQFTFQTSGGTILPLKTVEI